MTYSQMFSILAEIGLSPEKAARLLGVSGMTLRRWRSMPGGKPLPALYARAFEAAVEEMVSMGKISPDSAAVRGVMARSSMTSFAATVKTLGFTPDSLKASGDGSGAVVAGLAQIGSDSAKIKAVEQSRAKVSSFKKMSAQWRERITTLWSVVRSPRLTVMDKLVAYGALFYLISVFDLIPDTIPGFGLMDDFAVLGLACAYYWKRYPHLVKRKP